MKLNLSEVEHQYKMSLKQQHHQSSIVDYLHEQQQKHHQWTSKQQDKECIEKRNIKSSSSSSSKTANGKFLKLHNGNGDSLAAQTNRKHGNCFKRLANTIDWHQVNQYMDSFP